MANAVVVNVCVTVNVCVAVDVEGCGWAPESEQTDGVGLGYQA